jgi:hypothetical protein
MGEPPKDTLIPRRDVKSRIAQVALLVPSDDQIDRWHADGLLCEPHSGERPSVYGYTEMQQQRLLLITRIVSSLKSERVHSSEIAFWLCFNGATDIPPELVLEHIEATIKAFQSRWLRILNELGSRNEGSHIGILGVAKKLGWLLAKKLVLKVIPSLGHSSLAREFIGTGVALVLRISVKPNQYGDVAADLRRATTVLRRESGPPSEHVLRELFSVVSDMSQLLRLDDENAMLVAVRVIARQNPASILQVVESTRNALATGSRFFPWMTNPAAVPFFGPEDREFFGRYFAPALCGAMATLRDNEHAKQLNAELRAGNPERALAEWGQMKQVSDYVVETIALKGVEK